MGHLEGGFRRLGAILKASWLHLGGAWRLFEGLLGPLQGVLASSWGHLWASWGSWEYCGAASEPSLATFQVCCSRRPFFACFFDMLLHLFIFVRDGRSLENHEKPLLFLRFLIFQGVADTACILKQHSITCQKTSRKCMENLRILQVVRGSGRLRSQVWGDIWQLGRQDGVKKVS